MSALDTTELQAIAQAVHHAPSAPPAMREYLSFRVGDEHYGIDILQVQEIRSYEAPTRIAGAPPSVCGVTNLRGHIVPILDLRQHFGTDATLSAATVTIVLTVGATVVGAVVDGVSDVVAFDQQDIRPAPPLPSSFGADSIVGIASTQSSGSERLLVLLDVDALLASPDFGLSITP